MNLPDTSMKTIYIMNGFLDVTWFILNKIDPPGYCARFDNITVIEVGEEHENSAI